jgi:hypothetical protein
MVNLVHFAPPVGGWGNLSKNSTCSNAGRAKHDIVEQVEKIALTPNGYGLCNLLNYLLTEQVPKPHNPHILTQVAQELAHGEQVVTLYYLGG